MNYMRIYDAIELVYNINSTDDLLLIYDDLRIDSENKTKRQKMYIRMVFKAISLCHYNKSLKHYCSLIIKIYADKPDVCTCPSCFVYNHL